MKFTKSPRARFRLTLLSLLWAPLLLAQSAGTGALTGTVTDPSGAVITNVVVTATSTETGQSRTVSTGSDGSYRFSLLPPDTYRVRFMATGFKTAEVPSVKVNVTETPTLNYALEVGTQAEQVEVQADAAIIQTTTSTLGTVVGTRTVVGLPLSNRNYTQIVNLSAGVAAPVNNASSFGKATQDMSTNGNDPAQNNFQMDGVAIDNIANSGSSNDSGIYAGIGIPNPDAIQEFKIQTSTYDASYGRNPGANVNVVTKSGTNQFHGSAFEFFRNSDLNANDFFFNRSPANVGKKQVLNQNQFGGVVGGPIKKDKLFFFGSYQGTRQKNGVAAQGRTNYTFLPNIPLGDRSGGPGSSFATAVAAANCHGPGFGPPLACDGSNMGPVGLKILQLKNADGSYYIPSSQQFGPGAGLFSQPAIYRENQEIVNGDYLVNSKNTIAMRFFKSEDPRTQTLNGYVPGTPTTQLYSNTAAVLKLTSIIKDTFINEIRGSFQRNLSTASDSMPPGATDQNLGITPLIPALRAGGVATGPNATEPPNTVLILNGFNLFGGLNPVFSPTNQRQVADQISWTHGKHTIRAGFEKEWTTWPITFAGLERGFLFFGSFNDLLVGGPGSILQCLFCTRSGPDGIIHGYGLPNMNAFFQDDWRVTTKLTLNIGTRWEYDGTLSDKYGNLTTTWLSQLRTIPNSQVPAGPSLPGAYNAANFAGWVVPNNYTQHYPAPPPGVLISDRSVPIRDHPPLSNFGPRVGFAYEVSSKLVVRGGAGIFYDRVGADRFVHSVEQGNPYAVTVDYIAGNPNTLAVPFPPSPVVGEFAQRWIAPNCDTLPGGCAKNSSYLNVPFINEVMHTPTVRQYNLTFQYNFAPSWVLEAGYVGSSGINLTDYNHNYNVAGIATPSNPINGQRLTTTANVLERVPYLGYQAAGLQGTAYDLIESYNSLQVTVRKQLSRGFLVQGAYTYSKSLTNSFINTANSNLSTDTAQQYGPSEFSRPNRLVVNYGYDLPFGMKKGALGKIAGGWNISGVTTVQSGLPLTIIDSRGGTAFGTTSTTTQGGYSRAQLCPGATYDSIASSGSVEARLNGFFNNSAFCAPPAINPDGTPTTLAACPTCATLFGNSGVGIVGGPSQFNWDFTIMKNTPIGERQSVQFRAEFFNLFNHAQFDNPGGFPNAFGQVNVNSNSLTAPTFGQITSTAVNPRVIQLALKYTF
ncbi:MAG TPA: carboxypeptidase regulatory-like domain-containing protein [Bryobacteraceae bacterium]|nr:carboxypeptidase regulatory-like domain-containing protein [Bryobacteraceae bacterium]